LGVTRAAFGQFLARSEKGAEAWDRGTGEGRTSLRRLQWQTAQKSATMQIWLGKQWLGQVDKMERTDSVNATISAGVTMIAAPNLEVVPDRTSALREFERFQLQLRSTKPPLIEDAEVVPLPAREAV
jgi:hypothetical protein